MAITLSPSLANIPGPYVIGATGGSGTRVLARIVRQAAMFVGTNLNVTDDSLFFGNYSDRWIDLFLCGGARSSSRDTLTAMASDLDTIVAQHLSSFLADAPGSRWRAWGWKEPRSIFLLPFFHEHFPELKFLHVIRDGRDMAYSSNQNQLLKHGHTLLSREESSWAQPFRSMALWARLNARRADYGETYLGDRYLRIRFEDLCGAPVSTVERIFQFLGLEGDIETIVRLEVTPPLSLGRWRAQDPAQLEKLHQVGHSALERFGYLGAEGIAIPRIGVARPRVSARE